MSCNTCNRLCNNLILSQTVTFTNDTLVINIPQGSYGNNQKYCIVVAQAIPDTTTINAPVVITIGADAATTYPLVYCNGTPMLASNISTRTRYSTVVHTNVSGGVFSLLKRIPCANCSNQPAALPVAPAAV